jgi:replicative DNA helicase
VSTLKIPPHSIEAEQAVLGSILILSKADRLVGEIFDLINAGMFYNQSHQIIFNAMNRIGAKNEIDVVTVEEELSKTDESGAAGGFAYFGDLARNTPSSKNALKYAEIIIERYEKRKVLEILHNSIDQVYNKTETSETLTYLERNLAGIDLGGNYEPTHINTKIPDWLDVMQKRAENDQGAIGLKTGITALDNQIIGIQPNWLIVLAGRPSMGKTLVAQMIHSHISKTLPSQFFSMEMSSDEIMDRYVGVLAGVDVKNLKMGALTDLEWSRTHGVIEAMNQDRFKIYYDETPALALKQICHRVKSTIKKVGKIGLVTIDYIGLMEKERSESDSLAIGKITRGLKQLAKETNTPILLLVQANRGTDIVARPGMSNLAGSSAIESDADLVLFAHRDEVANPDTAFKGIIELIPAKFRHGTCNRTSYIGKREDKMGGTFYSLTELEAGELDNQNKTREEPARPKRFSKQRVSA